MGQFDPNNREVDLFTKQFNEAAKLQGTETIVKFISSTERDLYKDPSYEYHHWRELNVILNERPNRYVLDTYGWYNEDEEFVPMIMNVAKFDEHGRLVKPLKGSIIKLPYTLAEDDTRHRTYIVSESILTNPGSWMWTCKLTPYRKEFNPGDQEYESDDNYDFLDIKA